MGWATVPPARGDLGGRGLTITPSLEEDIPDLLQNIPGIKRRGFTLNFWKISVDVFFDVTKLEFLSQELMFVSFVTFFICI